MDFGDYQKKNSFDLGGFTSSSASNFYGSPFSTPSFGSTAYTPTLFTSTTTPSSFSHPFSTKTSTTTTTSSSFGATSANPINSFTFTNHVSAFGSSSSSSSCSSSSSTLSTDSVNASMEPQLSAKISAGNDIEHETPPPPAAVKSEETKSDAGESKDTAMVTERPKEEDKEHSSKFTYTRILKGITHNPHFTPLQSYSKRAREKMIAGWDEIFEETIDQIQSLTATTFSSNVDEQWKTIAELENLGYNVGRLKKRLDELTDAMSKRDSSQVEISELKTKAEDYKKEKKKIEGEIADLQVQAEKAQVMVDELMDQVRKMEDNLPVVDALFENLAMNPL